MQGRKVVVGLKDAGDYSEPKREQSHISVTSRHSARVTFQGLLQREIHQALANRANYHVYDVKAGKDSKEVTPKTITLAINRPRHALLDYKMPELSEKDTGSYRSTRSGTSSISRHKSTRGLGMKMSIDDIILGVRTITTYIFLNNDCIAFQWPL